MSFCARHSEVLDNSYDKSYSMAVIVCDATVVQDVLAQSAFQLLCPDFFFFHSFACQRIAAALCFAWCRNDYISAALSQGRIKNTSMLTCVFERTDSLTLHRPIVVLSQQGFAAKTLTYIVLVQRMYVCFIQMLLAITV